MRVASISRAKVAIGLLGGALAVVKPVPKAVEERPSPLYPFSVFVKLLLCVGMLLGLVNVQTLASWSTASTVETGALDAGTLDVTINGKLAGQVNLNGSTIETSWKIERMLPSERIPLEFTVKNASTGNATAKINVGAWASGALGPDLRLLFYQGSAVPAGLAPGDNAKLTNIDARTFRMGSCTGTDLGGTWLLFGASAAGANKTFMDAAEQPELAPGDSVTFCAIVAVDTNTNVSANSPVRGSTGTLHFPIYGKQVLS